MGFNKELLKGSTALLLLRQLSEKDMYGYELIKRVKDSSNGVILLKEGSVYPMLQALEADGAIISYWEDTDSARKRRYYHITDNGRARYEKARAEWKLYTDSVSLVLESFAAV